MANYKDELFLVQDFHVGDIVIINQNIAGMLKDEVGMVTDTNELHGIVEIRLSETLRYYNMLPQWLNHYKI